MTPEVVREDSSLAPEVVRDDSSLAARVVAQTVTESQDRIIAELVGRGRRVLIVALREDHGRRLRDHLRELGVGAALLSPSDSEGAAVELVPAQGQGEGTSGEERFDVVVLDDLEVARDAGHAMEEAAARLRPGGHMIVSAANASYLPVRLALLRGDLPAGLDGTEPHRLYLRADFETVLTTAGLTVHQLVRLTRSGVEQSAPGDNLPEDLIDALARDPEVWTERFIAVAVPVAVSGHLLERKVSDLASQTETALKEIEDLRALVAERAPQQDPASAVGVQNLVRELQSRDAALQQAARSLQGYLTEESSRPPAAVISDRDKYIVYQQVMARIRGTAAAALPPGSHVLVVSRGDDELLRLPSMEGRHFPQGENGVYAGYYPANSGQAIAHLEALRARGAEFLLFPATAIWWLDHYDGFRRYLDRHFRLVVNRPNTCLIYTLAAE